MTNIFSMNSVRLLALLSTVLSLALLSGCGAGSARSGNDDSQDLSRLESGPSPEDLKAMEAAAKGNSPGGAPPQAAQGSSPATP